VSFSLHLEDLKVAYGNRSTPIINGLNFRAGSGRCIGVEGNNGSGKSTLAHAIVGLIPYITPGRVDGHAWIDSKDLFDYNLSKRLGLVGYSFQDTESQILFGTVGDVLGLQERDTDHTLLEMAIASLGMEHLVDRTPDELSGGEAQRVALVTALRRNPKLIIYDEASSALDPQARRDFKHLVDDLKQGEHVLVLLGQQRHILGPYCDDVLSLQNGTLTEAPLHTNISPQQVDEFWCALSEFSSDSMEAPEVRLEDIEFARGTKKGFELGPLNLTLRPGEIVALVGPNGSGKTTLFLLLLGALKPRSGFFELAGRKYRNAVANPWPKTVTMVSQSPLEQIIAGTIAQEFGLNPSEPKSDAFARELLKHFPYLGMDRDPLELSHGQQRMLGMLASVLSRHPILLLDEPEQGIDARALTYVKGWLEINARAKSKTVLFSTHDLAFAASMASRCLLMSAGQIVGEIATKDPEELERWYFSHITTNES